MNRIKNTLFILCILAVLISLLSLSSLPGQANPIQMNSRIVDLRWQGDEIQQPIVPRNVVKSYNLTVFYSIDLGTWIAEALYDAWYGTTDNGYNKTVGVVFDVVDSSPWCSAHFKINVVNVMFSKSSTGNITMYVVLDENAPAYGSGYINIRASTGFIPITPIQGYTKVFNLSFTPEYLPYISPTIKKVNTIELTPMEQEDITFEVENLGNARTKVFLEVVNLPENWIGVVTNEITLDETIGSTAEATLSVQPPRNFGYYDEQQILRVKLTPARAENISQRGDPMYISFVVKSKGLGTPGFEGLVSITAFIVVSIGIYGWRKKKEE